MLAREGDERLSGTSKSKGLPRSDGDKTPDKKKRNDKQGSVGRALRTVYDDMLREDVPKDFIDLLGKLN